MSRMTKEEAIAVLTETQVVYFAPKGKEKAQEALDMAIEALQAETVQGVGRYENAMQKLREMPKYLNGVKEKQITKISASNTTKKPNDIVEQKNDVVAEQTDLISRADAIEAVEAKIKWFDGDAIEDRCKRDAFIQVLDEILTELPSADRPSGEWVVRENGNKECSLCGHERQDGWDYFCGYCGANMRGGVK